MSPGFLTQPITSDKDYIYGLTAALPDMNCWSDTSVAFMGQLWFIGFLTKVLGTPLQEKYGHLPFLKAVLIPLNILSFQLQYLPKSYFLRCVGFCIAGFCKLKTVPLLINLKDSVEKKRANFTTTFFYMFYFSVIACFCIYIHYISKNAIYYLHFTNAFSIMCAFIIVVIGVDSPLRSIEKGKQQEAKKSLQFIAWLNSKFKFFRQDHCTFDNVTICST